MYQADCILLVALATNETIVYEYERVLLGMKSTARKELVLLHHKRHNLSGLTRQWLRTRLWINAHHHVRLGVVSHLGSFCS